MNTRSKNYPTLRFVAERLDKISRTIERDFFNNDNLSKTLRCSLATIILELRSHCNTCFHYAPQIPIEETNYPRTIDDVLDKMEELIR